MNETPLTADQMERVLQLVRGRALATDAMATVALTMLVERGILDRDETVVMLNRAASTMDETGDDLPPGGTDILAWSEGATALRQFAGLLSGMPKIQHPRG